MKQYIKLKEGKSYKIRSKLSYEKTKVHIEYILDNKQYPEESFKLIVYRVWSTHRKHWVYDTMMYWRLAILNDWEYSREGFSISNRTKIKSTA